jgi:hypothetical protein
MMVVAVVLVVGFLIAVVKGLMAYRAERQARADEAARDAKILRMTAKDCLGRVVTESGEDIRLYVITDPDDGTQYVVSDHGGVCERGSNEDDEE